MYLRVHFRCQRSTFCILFSFEGFPIQYLVKVLLADPGSQGKKNLFTKSCFSYASLTLWRIYGEWAYECSSP